MAVAGACKVALVNMPMAPATRPSIQLGILRSLLDGAGIEALEFHGCLDFFEILVRERLVMLAQATASSLLSEWLFSERPVEAIAGRAARGFLRQAAGAAGLDLERLRPLQEEGVPAFLDRMADAIAASGARVACFTLSFAQRNASFALARRLKEKRPEVVTVFGGAASQVFEEACREYLRAVPGTDYFLLGEAEGRFVPLVEALLAQRSPAHVPGVLYWQGSAPRSAEGVLCTGPEPGPVSVEEMARPTVGGWFEHVGRLSRTARAYMERVVPLEIGRGCTWADAAPCRFCAFTFHGRYRAKSRAQVVDEVRAQRRAHGTGAFYVMDNVVPARAIRDLLPAMREAVPDLSIPFVEVLATLCRADLETLAAAGATLVQAGTECFDDGLLRRIGKGTSTFHNVRFMMQARECGLGVSHNVLLGVPQATPEEIEGQRRTLELLFHLDPPQPLELQLVRFSAYFHHPQESGLENLRPHPSCAAALPDGVEAARVAYEFVADPALPVRALYASTLEVLHRWRMAWSRSPLPFLVHEERRGGGMTVVDGREPGAEPVVHRLEGLHGQVHRLLLEGPMRMDFLVRGLEDLAVHATRPELEAVLDSLVARRLLLERGGRWMALSQDATRLRRWRADLPAPGAG